MFFYRRRSAEPVDLARTFTPEESARIAGLRLRFLTHPEHFKLGLDHHRLEFARWLVDHGRISEWDEREPLCAREAMPPTWRIR